SPWHKSAITKNAPKWTETISTMVEKGLMIIRIAKARITNGKALTTSECETIGRDWKAITNVNRYKASGTTQNNGTAATSVEIWSVTGGRRREGIAASPTKPKLSRHVGGAVSCLGTIGAADEKLAKRSIRTPQSAIIRIRR